LFYPIIPQITSTVGNALEIDLLKSEWPETKKTDFEEDAQIVEKIIEFNSFVWKSKKEKGISLKEPIPGIEIPEQLKNFEKDLRSCHKI
jgi:valyl-tRNA synthetase